MSNDLDQPATKRDLKDAIADLKIYILDRETALTWRIILLAFAIVTSMCGAQLGIFIFVLGHWKP